LSSAASIAEKHAAIEAADNLRVRLLDFEKKASSLTVDYFNFIADPQL